MFDWKYDTSFSFLILDKTGNKVPVSDWEQIQSEYLSQISILYELFDNGFAEHTSNAYRVEAMEILNLSEIDKQILCLPDQYPYEIYIQSDGQLNQPSFKFKYGFYDFTPNGSRLAVKRNGPIVEVENRTYLLSINQFLICQAMDEFNALSEPERTFQNNLKCFANIIALSKDAASLLDSYLQNEKVCYPDKIRIELEYNNGVLEVIPTIETESRNGFTNVFDQFQSIKDVYSITDNEGGKTRVVIDDKQKEELQKVKTNRRITDKKTIEEIIEHPEKFFDDEKIDLSVFYSERVKEIGIYKPKFYPFVCPYKSEWIPGMDIKEGPTQGTKRIHFKTLDELNEFETIKQKAQKSGKNSFDWRGTEIPVEEAEKFIHFAKKQFENTQEPPKKDEKINGVEVLIILENAEILEYKEDSEQITSFNHNFSKIGNLNSFIELKDHQVEGIAWLQSLFKEKYGGCLLADDMGLGKTLQLLYFIEWHSQHTQLSKPYLIVAPVSLLENWESEYQKFFSPQNLSITLAYGETRLSKEYNRNEIAQLQRKHIILTNYETLKAYQFNLCAVDYAVVVLDEAQKIKTPGTLVTNVSKALKADFKITMTGTPVENTLVDLWCIMDFSKPGLLGNAKEFAKEFQKPLEDKETDIKALGEKLRNKIGIFIKRRLKQDVAKDLPKKFDNANSRLKKEMPLTQLERYKVEIEQAKNIDLTGIHRRNQILKSLWAIRDISDHPYLADSQLSKFKTDEIISSSAKLQIVIELLTEIQASKEKVIVFADRKETQMMLQQVIYDKFGVFPSIVNGDTPTTKQAEGKTKLSRQQTIDRFQDEDGFNVIVMSQLAAGIGLNVTQANHIIHYSRHWNPAKEEQATDRAYRIGQTKDVHVYYPMAIFPDEMKNEDGTKHKSFDEILDALLTNKKHLATTTLFPTEQAEVKPDELFGQTFEFDTNSKLAPLSIGAIDKLKDDVFEAYIAALYAKQGFQTFLTPITNDKGVDVVALKDGENYLFQVKQSKSLIGIDSIQEVYTAKNYYERIFKEKFALVVITNSSFSSSADKLARDNNVDLISRKQLEKLISEYEVTIQDVNKHESQRKNRI